MSDKLLVGDLAIKAGSTSVSIIVPMVDGNPTPVTGKVAADMTIRYVRQGASAAVAVTPSNLTNFDDAYSSGGWKEDGTTGFYRFDIPDAALATGADWVNIHFVAAGVSPWTWKLIALPTYANMADAIFDSAVVESEGSYTAQQVLSILLAAMAGRTTNSGLTFKTPNNVATRITATTDGSKNRTAITLNPSS